MLLARVSKQGTTQNMQFRSGKCRRLKATEIRITSASPYLSLACMQHHCNKRWTHHLIFFLIRSWLVWPHFFFLQFTARGCSRA